MLYFSLIRSSIAAIFVLILLVGCGSVPAAKHNNADKGLQLVSQAKALIGTPYLYGGSSPKGFDCSGFVQFVHHKVGINIPRTTLVQLKKSRYINLSQLQPGDLIFFRLSGRKASHVSIYIGNNQMIHAPSSGKRVSTANLDAGNGYWRQRIIGTGRLY